MELERDEFVVTLDASQTDVADLLAASEQSGFPARVVTEAAELTQIEPPSVEVSPPGEVEEPQFFREAVRRAGLEGKPLVLDFMAVWCVPCQRMRKETFPDPRVARLLERCVFLSIDTDEHPDLARKFGVVGLPDIRFLDADGEEVRRYRDFQSPQAFAEALEWLLER